MFHIDLPFSFAALFGIQPNLLCVDAQQYYEGLEVQHRQYYDYLLKLLQNNRWAQYYCDLSGFTLHCVKTRFNQHLDDNSAYRLFFLIEAKTQRLLLLMNLKISGSEHTSQHHLNAVQALLGSLHSRYGLTPSTVVASKFLVPLAVDAKEIETSSSNASTSATSSTVQPPQEAIPQIETLFAEIDKRNVTRKNISNLIVALISRYNQLQQAPTEDELYIKLFTKLLNLLAKPSLQLYFSKKRQTGYLTINLGDSSDIQALAEFANDSLAWISSLVSCFEHVKKTDKEILPEPFWAMVFNSFTVAPDFIADALLQLSPTAMPKSRSLINAVFMHCADYFAEGYLNYNHIQLLLQIIDQNNLLSFLNNNTTSLLLEILLQFQVARRLTDSTTSGESANLQTSSTSTQNILGRLQHATSSLNFVLAERLLQQMLPRLEYAHWKIIFDDEYDLLNGNLFKECYRELANIGITQKLTLILGWLFANKEEKSIDYSKILLELRQEYKASDLETQVAANSILQQYALFLQGTCFDELLLEIAKVRQKSLSSESNDNNNNTATSSKSSSSTSSINTSKKDNRSKKAATTAKQKAHYVPVKIIKTTLEDFIAIYRNYFGQKNVTKTLLLKISNCLASHTSRQDLSFSDPSLESYFVERFLKSWGKYNLIELAALEGNQSLLNLLCRYSLSKDPTLMHKYNPAALKIAALRCNLSMVSLLVYVYGYDPNYCDEHQFSILSSIINEHRDGHNLPKNIYNVYRTLLLAGADINRCNFEGMPPLYRAIASHYPLNIIKLMLDFGADPNLPVYYNYGDRISAYDIALGLRRLNPQLEALLTSYGGIIVSGCTEMVHMPMDQAAKEGRRHEPRSRQDLGPEHLQSQLPPARMQMRKLLADCYMNKISPRTLLQAIPKNEFSININVMGYSLLHKVLTDLDMELVKEILLDYKPNLRLQCIVTEFECYPGGYLHFCIYYELTDFIPMLIEHGCPLEDYNQHGLAPMHLAVMKGDIGAIVELVKAGANPLIATKDGKTMAVYCLEVQNGEILRFLKAITPTNAQLLLANMSQDWLLRQAMLHGREGGLVLVLKQLAQLSTVSEDNLQNTALHQLCRGRSKNWLRLLKDIIKFIDTELLPIENIHFTLRNSDNKTPLNLLVEQESRPRSKTEQELYDEVKADFIRLAVHKMYPTPQAGVYVVVDVIGNLIIKQGTVDDEQIDHEIQLAGRARQSTQVYMPGIDMPTRYPKSS